MLKHRAHVRNFQDVDVLAVKCSLRYTAESAILMDTDQGFVSDGSWRCTSEKPAGSWFIPKYDDSRWASASVISNDDVPFNDQYDTMSYTILI